MKHEVPFNKRFNSLLWCGLLMTGIAYLFTNYMVNSKLAIELNGRVLRTNVMLADEIKKISLVLGSMNYQFANNDSVSYQEFIEQTNSLVRQLPGIQVLGWAPKVNRNEIRGFLPDTQGEVDGNFKIATYNNRADTAHQTLYPFTYINPMATNGGMLGFDSYSHVSSQQTIEKAISSNSISITEPISLVQFGEKNTGFIGFSAVISQKTNVHTGLVFAVYNINDFINETILTDLESFNIDIYDISAKPKVLYSSKYLKAQSEQLASFSSHVINVFDRQWKVVYSAKNMSGLFMPNWLSFSVFLLGVLITFLLSVIFKNNAIHKLSLEHEIATRTGQLENAIKQKDVLLKEIHHRVKNSLQITSSILRLQRYRINDEVASQALESSENRIAAISTVHNLLYGSNEYEAVPIDQYLNSLINHNSTLAGIKISMNCPSDHIRVDLATPLGLIVNELISNAVKHGFKDRFEYENQITIDVKITEESIMYLQICDNGVGLPDNFNVSDSEGLGFELVETLCSQIDAHFSRVTVKEGCGFQIAVSVKEFH